MDFKKLYKQGRKDQELDLDEELTWMAIEQSLEKPKKKRRFLWIWLGAGLLMLTLIAHLLIYGTLSSDDVHADLTSPETKTLSNEHNAPRAIAENRVEGVEETVKNTESLEQDIAEVTHKPLNNNYPSFNKNTDNVSTNTNLDNRNFQTPSIKSSRINTSYTPSRSSDINEQGAIYSTRQSLKITPTPAPSILFSRSNESLPEVDVEKNLHSEDADGYYEPLTPLATRLPSLILPRHMVKVDEPELSEKLQGDMLSLSFYAGYQSYSNSLEALSPSVQSWIDLHDESNTSRLSGTVCVMLNYIHRSGLGIGTGLKARRVAEWYDATVVRSTPVMIASDSAEYVVVNGVRSFKSGFLTGVQVDRTRYVTPIKRIYLDIPVAISYQRTWSRLRLGASLAYNLNVAHSYYGRSYVEDLELLDRSQLLERGTYKLSGLHSMNASIFVERDLSDRISLALSANYWNQLTSSMSESTQVRERYRGVGIGLSVKRKFVLGR